MNKMNDSSASNDREAALRARIAELERALARLHRQQEAFAFGISHDLRAPMRAIDGFAVQLGRRLGADIAPGVADYLQRIRENVARTGGLIDSLLEYARIGRAELQRRPVDLSFLAEWVLMDLQTLHPEVAVEAEVQPDLWVRGDERLLRLLLCKLLENAWRFRVPGEAVRVRVSAIQADDGLHLEVADRGIGMEIKQPSQPFEPFQRLHSAGQGSGDGLGLTIAQAVVEQHGGRIRAESEPGAGSTLHIWLPSGGDEAAG
ncbi:hypothetical protein EBB59_04285 [Lysobacter pythonis]|uniref:histidine kinase n=1 Tax=Solilutibacter pythonis TaxID=2483112 RepID=A0A3M2I0F1_9GAMM|nr:ATP-binding protein [Lysobacter pythonis]RMH93865.1 hypothetical protein EBB59_04285 [Lysobacter pythonis]